MVLSLKANKKRILAVIILIGVVILGITVLPKLTEAPVTYQGGTEEERISYLESFGYTVSEDPVDVRTVTIPKEFSDIYTEYNEMQKAQGFDLKPYKGKECKQYVYLITNYPGTESEIHATMLVYQNIIIGGDVSCAELNGFMHGFALDSAYFGDSAQNKVAVTESESKEPVESSSQAESEVSEDSEVKTDNEETKETAATEAGEEGNIYPTD